MVDAAKPVQRRGEDVVEFAEAARRAQARRIEELGKERELGQ